MAVNHVFVTRRNFDGNDVAGKFGGEGQLTGDADGTVFGHENGATAGNAPDHAKEASTAGELGVRGHLDGTAHPGKFTRLGDDGFVRFECELQNRHGGAGNAALHSVSRCGEWWA